MSEAGPIGGEEEEEEEEEEVELEGEVCLFIGCNLNL